MSRRKSLLCLWIVISAALAPLCRADSKASRGPVAKDGKTLDKQALILENDYLRAAITTNQYAGQIMSLIYKPTGVELAPARHVQGYCKDRMGEDRYFWRRKSRDYAGRLLPGDQKVVRGEVSYRWDYDYNDRKTTIRVSKLYTLRRDQSILHVRWRLENVGKRAVSMSPWVKHVGGQSKTCLAGPTMTVLEGGAQPVGTDFYGAVRNWSARLSSGASSEKLPMVLSVMDFRQVYQHFPWAGRERYTLETILRRITLEPGKSWETTYALGVMANLGAVAWASPELAAGIGPKLERIEPQKQQTFRVEIAPAVRLGAVRLEGEIARRDGGAAEALPPREVVLEPGRIGRVTYSFTPPRPGIYDLKLSVYDNQTLIPLGKSVDSQEAGIVIPLVVGEPPEKVMTAWKASGPAWRSREPRMLEPVRVLARKNGVSVGQVRVLDRVFPEDSFVFTAEPTGELSMTAARGEWESAQFVVALDKQAPAGGFRAVMEPLKSEAGKQLPAPELWEVHTVKTTTPSGYRDYPVGQWPDPLYPVVKSALTPGEKRTFWITQHVPREAPAGLYSSRVRVLRDGAEVSAFAVRLRVRSFALPKRPALQACTNQVGWTPRRIAGNLKPLGFEYENWGEVREIYWKMCTDYGWSPMMYTGPDMWARYKDRGRGMTVFQAGKRSEEWLKENDLLKYSFTYAPFDEHADAVVPQVVEWIKKWKAECDIPVMDCFYGSRVEPLFGLVDIWCGQSPRQDWARKRREAGDRFWSVNNALIWFIEYEPVQGRRQFWDDFAAGVDGRMLYSNIRWSEDVFEKNWSGGGNYLGCTIYPSPEGLAKSIRWEALRDGLEDYDYLFLLRRVLESYEREGRKDAPDVAAAARKIVKNDALMATVSTPEELLDRREEVGDLIEKLNARPE